MHPSLRMRSHAIAITLQCALFCFLMGAADLFMLGPDDAVAAQIDLRPSLMVGEEYNDNIFLTPTGKVEDFITTIAPAFTLAHNTSFWTWNIDFVYYYRDYARGTVTRDQTYNALVAEHTNLVENLFFLDVSDLYQRVSTNVAQAYIAQQSLFLNQTDQNIFTVNPYLNLVSGPSHTAQVGYQYVNTWYKDPLAYNTVDNIGYIVMGTPLSSNLTVTGGIRYTRDLNSLNGYFITEIYTGGVYTYSPRSSFICYLGEDWLRFAGYPTIQHLYWDLGIIQHYSTMTLMIETKTGYVHDPYLVLRRVDQLEITLTKEQSARTSLSGVLGWYQYLNAAQEHLETNEYVVTARLRHILTPRWTLSGELSNTIYQDFVAGTDTYIYHIMAELEHSLLTDLMLSASWIYDYTYSPDVYSDNSRVNRVQVALTKRF
jgi:hypothetical protein